ncbi:MAG: hypothetical protein AB8H47_04835 [Bacteroidia bacterium]
MKLQKTQRFASIYLLTFGVSLLLTLGGCTERQISTQAEAETPQIDAESVFANLESLLIDATEEGLPNGTISRSQWTYRYEDCNLVITETLSYKRTKAPFGGFNANTFSTAWESVRRLPLAQLDAKLLQQKGLYLTIHTLESQNLIKEESRYAEAYLAYYKAENGQAHPANSNLTYNLISLPVKEAALGSEAIEGLQRLITHCQAY